MVFRIFAAALAAGLLSAILISGLQSITTAPMILEAETYEVVSHDQGAGEHEHHDAAWMPADGIERTLYSLLANFGAGVGFSLLLIVGLTFDLPGLSGGRGVLWGMGGFAVFTLAPALGLPPGVPGLAVPDEQAAQIWWLGTVLLSGSGLACLVFGKSAVVKLLGPVLLVLPHVWGAPPVFGESLVPATMAARFAATSIVLSAVLWLAIGYFCGAIFARLNEKSPTP